MPIRQRYYGSDIPFCAWMRAQKDELPSYSRTYGYVASDVDLHLHVYNTPVDGIGTREIQGLMYLEVKSRGGSVPSSQLDTLSKINATISRKPRQFCRETLRHFGVSILFMSGTTPDDSEELKWGRFDEKRLNVQPITKTQLFQLMRFDIHPDSLLPQPFRRHHKTQQILQMVHAPLGFTYQQPVIKRS